MSKIYDTFGKGVGNKVITTISKQIASIMINKRHWVVEKFTQQIRCTKVVTNSANPCKIDGYIGSLTLFLPMDVNPGKFCSPICPLTLFFHLGPMLHMFWAC